MPSTESTNLSSMLMSSSDKQSPTDGIIGFSSILTIPFTDKSILNFKKRRQYYYNINFIPLRKEKGICISEGREIENMGGAEGRGGRNKEKNLSIKFVSSVSSVC